jgi:hypothetical protein
MLDIGGCHEMDATSEPRSIEDFNCPVTIGELHAISKNDRTASDKGGQCEAEVMNVNLCRIADVR